MLVQLNLLWWSLTCNSEIPAFNDKALAPFMLSQLVILSPLQELAA